MLAICIECSHQRGMGHLFRALNLAQALERRQEEYIVLVNDDAAAWRILSEHGIAPVIVDLCDIESDWEGRLIAERGITVWLNDRLDTSAETAEHVKAAGIPLFTVDDMGSGGALSDGNFASLIFENIEKIPGKRVYAGCDYLILNPEIETHKRLRSKVERILVTLGGSDTYGVTPRVIEFLKRCREEGGSCFGDAAEHALCKKVTILLGPDSVIREEAERAAAGTDFEIASSVPSLIAFMEQFDLAVTGGGVTAFEAAASGLPCVVIANEPHEIQIGRYLERSGSAVFAGYYREMHLEKIKEITELSSMSRRGMETVGTAGADRICEIVLKSRRKQ